jgi:hypothetical protein
MHFATTCKPTPAALRRRAAKVVKLCGELEDLGRRWNPKGRHFKTRRDLVETSREVRVTFERAIAMLTGR